MWRSNHGKILLIAMFAVLTIISTAACADGNGEIETVGVQAYAGPAADNNYTIWVDCTVRNHGDATDVQVRAFVAETGSFYIFDDEETREKAVTIPMGVNSVRTVTFAFSGAGRIDPYPFEDTGPGLAGHDV